MWSNVMQYLGPERLNVGELQGLAHTSKLNLAGMQRWGYLIVQPNPADSRPKPPRRDWLVRPTAKGRRAQQVWQPLFGVIEMRWRERFRDDEINRLRNSLRRLVHRFPIDLPDYLPILGYGMCAETLRQERDPSATSDSVDAATFTLPALLSKVLLAFTLAFERKSDLSLPISANVIRLLGNKGLRLHDLPRLSGVSKEAIQMAIGFLEKRGYVSLESDPATARTKLIRLTPEGQRAQDAYRERLGVIEERWEEKFGQDNIRALRESLEKLVGEPNAQASPLFRGLQPYPNGWRASVPKPETLPHYPMVLHRGGYPDGS